MSAPALHRPGRFARVLRASLLGLVTLVGALASPSTADAFSPFLVIPPPADAERSPAYVYANMTNEEAFAELDRRQIPYIKEGPVYGVRAPIRLAGRLHGVQFHSSLPEEQWATTVFEILDARLALTLDDFAVLLEKHDIDEVVHFTMYRPNVAQEPAHGVKAAPSKPEKGAKADKPLDKPSASDKPPSSDKPAADKPSSSDKPSPVDKAAPKKPSASSKVDPKDAKKGATKPKASPLPEARPLDPKAKPDKGGKVEPAGKKQKVDKVTPKAAKADKPAKPPSAPASTSPSSSPSPSKARSGAVAHRATKDVKKEAPKVSAAKVEPGKVEKPKANAPAEKVDLEKEVPKKPAGRWAPPGTRHPAGLAIDVGGFHKRGGGWISVGWNFQGKLGERTCGPGARVPESSEAKELRSIVCEAQDLGIFTYVLTPNYDAPHADHFHMEIKPGVRWFLYH